MKLAIVVAVIIMMAVVGVAVPQEGAVVETVDPMAVPLDILSGISDCSTLLQLSHAALNVSVGSDLPSSIAQDMTPEPVDGTVRMASSYESAVMSVRFQFRQMWEATWRRTVEVCEAHIAQ